MGSPKGIRVFLRIRPAAKGLPRPLKAPSSSSSGGGGGKNNGGGSVDDGVNSTYAIEHTFEQSTVRFHMNRRADDDVVNNTQEDYRFTFRRAFEPNATQAEVFSTVAKDCVLAALDGYNSTIFAYGQTGSGKTYSITGGTESYEDRGIIPRALSLLYEEVAKRRQQQESTFVIAVSYLQIYNDKGQDLLNRGRDAQRLEDLPPVTIHEGAEDDVLLKGLAQHSAPNTQEALNLLFLGDTNRLYCETPMNKTSSRSHCVFTLYIEARTHDSSVVRRSKLHFVDLAGSERVSKTGVSGTVLTEAKHINLSLHYLEQVIMALSEQASGRREHVPFRNSFMTMVLRDSLGGNCRTSMLATAHQALDQLPETISTCRFAQRVALIKQEARINEEVDPHLLVRKLKIELQQLRDQLAFYMKDGGGEPDRVLSDDEKQRCREMVLRFVGDAEGGARIEGFDGDLGRIYYCFDVLKRMLLDGTGRNECSSSDNGVSSGGNTDTGRPVMRGNQLQQVEMYRARVDALETSLRQKENEMNMLFNVLQKSQLVHFNAETQTGPGETASCMMDSNNTNQGTGGMAAMALLQTASSSSAISLQDATARPDATVEGEEGDKPLLPPNRPSSATRRALCEQLPPAEATAVDEFFRRQQQLNEGYDLSSLTNADLLQDRAAAFDSFTRSYRQYERIEENKRDLKGYYETCKATARRLNEVVDRIKRVKEQIQRLRAERALQGVEVIDDAERNALQELASQKTLYNELAASLRVQKETIDSMHLFMKRAQDRLTKDFEDWLQIRQRQLVMATAGCAGVDGSSARNANADSTNSHPRIATTTIPASMSPTSSPLNPFGQRPQPVLEQQMTTSLQVLPPLREDTMSLGRSSGSGTAHSVCGDRSNGLGRAVSRSVVDRLSSYPSTAPPSVSNSLRDPPLPAHTTRLSSVPHVSVNPTVVSNDWIDTSVPIGGSVNNSSGGTATPNAPNPYAPQHPSTGDAMADKQLAALYKARDVMRLQFQS